jgi:hypothetical protein
MLFPMYIFQEDVEKKSRIPIPPSNGQLYAWLISGTSGRCLCCEDVYEGAHIASLKDKDLNEDEI